MFFIGLKADLQLKWRRNDVGKTPPGAKMANPRDPASDEVQTFAYDFPR